MYKTYESVCLAVIVCSQFYMHMYSIYIKFKLIHFHLLFKKNYVRMHVVNVIGSSMLNYWVVAKLLAFFIRIAEISFASMKMHSDGQG